MAKKLNWDKVKNDRKSDSKKTRHEKDLEKKKSKR